MLECQLWLGTILLAPSQQQINKGELRIDAHKTNCLSHYFNSRMDFTQDRLLTPSATEPCQMTESLLIQCDQRSRHQVHLIAAKAFFFTTPKKLFTIVWRMFLNPTRVFARNQRTDPMQWQFKPRFIPVVVELQVAQMMIFVTTQRPLKRLTVWRTNPRKSTTTTTTMTTKTFI